MILSLITFILRTENISLNSRDVEVRLAWRLAKYILG